MNTKSKKERKKGNPSKQKQKGRKKRGKKGNRERKAAEEMNPKLQEAYAFLNELALGLDQRT